MRAPRVDEAQARALATEVDSNQRAGELRGCFTVEQLATIPRDAILAIVIGASSINDACHEGVEVANSERRAVVFDFNDQLVVCKPGGDAADLAKAWWRVAFPKSARRR